MTTVLWLLVVAGGPLLIGIVLAYGMLNRRRLTPSEDAKRNQAIRKMYNSESN